MHYTIDPATINTLVFELLPFSFIGICLYLIFYYLQRARTLEAVPESKIRSAAQGYVEMIGKTSAWNNQTLTAKLSGEPCVWYHYRIEEWRTRSVVTDYTNNITRTQSHWVALEEYKSPNYFIFQDNTGECVVDPLKATIVPPRPLVWKGFSAKNPPKPPKTLWSKIWHSFGSYRYVEYLLPANCTVFVTGMFYTYFKDNTQVQSNSLWMQYLNDKNSNQLHVLSGQGLPRESTFLISSKTQQQMITSFRLKAFIYFVLFIILCVITVKVISENTPTGRVYSHILK